MTSVLNAKGKPFSWSYSRLADFETCPRQYAAKHFYCTAPFHETEAIIWGNRVHALPEKRIKGIPHDDPEAELEVQPYLNAILSSPHKKEAEVELALTRAMRPCKWFDKNAWLRAKIDVVVTKDIGTNGMKACTILDWKGLALDTLLPTPDGWITIRDIQEGGSVFSGDGTVCRVNGKSPIFSRRCFEIVFMDGASVVCDDQHLWLTRICGGGGSQKVRSTSEMFNMFLAGVRTSIPVGGAAEYQDRDLPIHPYVLGCWLGDGKKTNGEICKPNDDLFEEIRRCGYDVSKNIASENRCQTRTIYGLSRALSDCGLIKNKHIPTEYRTAGYSQRLSLLRGLFDTDGTWNAIRKQASFTTVDKQLACHVSELISSLGQRPYMVELTKRGFGKTILAYDVVFTPVGFNPFVTHKKASQVTEPTWMNRSTRRYIKTIREVPSVLTQCISVDSVDNTYLCTDRYIVTHNTGRTIKDNDDQIRLNFAALSVVRPSLVYFEGKYIWTKHKVTTGARPASKEDIPAIWAEFLPRVHRMEDAWNNERFPPKQSGLCSAKWCPVEGCEMRRG